MKKIISFISLAFIFSTMFGCSNPKPLEKITLETLNGSGTDENPYHLVVVKGETNTLNLITTPTNYIGDLKAYEAEPTEIGYLELLEDSFHGLDINLTNTTLSFKALAFGTYYIKVQSGLIYTIIQVDVERGEVNYQNTLKVLAIGNSFSEDGLEYLYKIAHDYGVKDIVIGNMCIDGASLETHVSSYENNYYNYKYKKNNSDNWEISTGKALLFGLQDEDWDIIAIQQVSGSSGRPLTYEPYLGKLITFVNENKTNPWAKVYWHMTWAYQNDSTHKDFPLYNKNQMTMYEAIINTTQTLISTNALISGIIPAGTTIQNLRTSYLGDTLTNDGYHLHLPKGRYAAAMTWFKYITNLSIENITYRPLGLNELDLANIKEAVNNAINNPFIVTNSTYTS